MVSVGWRDWKNPFEAGFEKKIKKKPTYLNFPCLRPLKLGGQAEPRFPYPPRPPDQKLEENNVWKREKQDSTPERTFYSLRYVRHGGLKKGTDDSAKAIANKRIAV